MKMKTAAAIILLIFSASLAAYGLPDRLDIEPAAARLVDSLDGSVFSYTANEAFLETARIQHEASMAAIGPRLDFELEGTGGNSFRTLLPDDIEILNNYSFSASPGLSYSQLLPSSGTLTAGVSDAVEAAGIEESNYLLQPQSDLSVSNEISLSIALSQPLYGGNAYEARLDKIEENLHITEAGYMQNRNRIIISAVTDYYELLKSAYQIELIRARVETNAGQLLRIEKEFQLGAASKSAVNSAKAAALQSEADMLKAVQHNGSLNSLYSSIYNCNFEYPEGYPDLSMLKVLPVPRTDDQELAAILFEGNHDLRASMSRVKTAESELVLEECDAAPELSAGGSYTLSGGISDPSLYSDGLSFGLGLSFPLLDGGLSAAKIKGKRNEALRLRADLNDSRERILSQLRLLLDSLELYGRLSEIYLLQEETGSLELEAGLKEFELGAFTQSGLLDLQVSLENIRMSVLSNIIDSNISVLKLYDLLGYDLKNLIGEGHASE